MGKAQVCSRESVPWVLWRVLICFLKVRAFGEVSGKDLNRIFLSFPGVSFNVLIHQNVLRGLGPTDGSVLGHGVIVHYIWS